MVAAWPEGGVLPGLHGRPSQQISTLMGLSACCPVSAFSAAVCGCGGEEKARLKHGLFHTDRWEPPLFQTHALMNILIRRRVATGQDLARRIPWGGRRGSQSSLRTRVSGDYHAGHVSMTADRRLLARSLQLSRLCAAFVRRFVPFSCSARGALNRSSHNTEIKRREK